MRINTEYKTGRSAYAFVLKRYLKNLIKRLRKFKAIITKKDLDEVLIQPAIDFKKSKWW